MKKFLIRNGRKYRQFSVLYKPGSSDRATGIYTRDDPIKNHHDGQEEDWGIWHPNRSAAQLLTRLKGDRSFTFTKEGQEIIVYTHPFGFFTRGESLL